MSLLPRQPQRALYAMLGIGTFWQDYEEHLQALIKQVRVATDNIVQSGPFAGMRMNVDESGRFWV